MKHTVPFTLKEVSHLGTNMKLYLGQIGGNSTSNICFLMDCNRSEALTLTTVGSLGFPQPWTWATPSHVVIITVLYLPNLYQEGRRLWQLRRIWKAWLCTLNLTDQELLKIPNSHVSNTSTTCSSPEVGGKMPSGSNRPARSRSPKQHSTQQDQE